MEQKNRVVIKNSDNKLIKSKNNSYLWEILESENKINFLNDKIDENFELLKQNYYNKKIAISSLKQIIANTAGVGLIASITFYPGIDSLISTTGILLTAGIFASIPIKIIKKSDNENNLIQQIIPCLQEEKIKTDDSLRKIKEKIKITEENYDVDDSSIRQYSDDDLEYIYSKDKKRVKVKIK